MVFVNIVSWNSIKYLPDALKSIFNQTYNNFSVLVVDNGSTDGTVEFLRANYSQVLILKNQRNLGFAGAHNQGVKFVFSLCEKNHFDLENNYILITNPDIILTPDFLEQIISRADACSAGASFGGKLLKIFNDDELVERQAAIIDSAGLRIFRNRRVSERGAGEEDRGQYNSEEEVFGVSAALALFRLSSIQGAETKNGYFDSRYFSYKEDVDLAWRLRLFGWKSFYIGAAVAHHYRGAYGSEKRNLITAIRERKAKSRAINFYSTTNHLFTILKNDFGINFLRDFPRIFYHEFLKFIYILFFETKNLNAYFHFAKNYSKNLAARKEIMSRAAIDHKEMRKWFS